MSEESRLQGHELFASVYNWSCSHPIIKKLQDLGVRVFLKPGPESGSPTIVDAIDLLAKSIKGELRFPYKDSFDCDPNIICIRQSSSYNIVHKQRP